MYANLKTFLLFTCNRIIMCPSLCVTKTFWGWLSLGKTKRTSICMICCYFEEIQILHYKVFNSCVEDPKLEALKT